MPSAACHDHYGADLLHPALHLCTQDPTPNGAQACAGDSGSPVMVRRDGVLQVAGVVTWGGETLGRECGEGPADVSERVLAAPRARHRRAAAHARAVRRAARARAPHAARCGAA